MTSDAMPDRGNDPPLSVAARRAQILEHIQAVGGASLAELARDYEVSAITVHRDLDYLAREGLVERFHGGARAISEARAGGIETAWERRLRQSGPAKDAIAAHVRASILNGATIFLDASSTCLALAHRLDLEPPEELAVVTNSPAIALGLESSAVRVIVVPGEVDLRMRAIADGWTVEFLRRVSIDTAFVSGSGLDLEHGLTTSRRQLADTLNAACSAAAKTVALVDASKFGRASLVPIAEAASFDTVVTDAGIDADVVDQYRRAGVKLEVAPSMLDNDE
jgi:DeoR/GlpR family transcriptional regulator of sugar metabolism